MVRITACGSGAFKAGPLFAALAFCAATAAFAGGLSSLSVSAYMDNFDNPAPRVAENGSVPIGIDGSWFDSGACELLVDGAPVSASAGGMATYALAADASTWRTYRLTLRSDGAETTRFVTVYPYAGFLCTIHGLSADGGFLDARPAGTVRKLRYDTVLPVTYSGIWSEGAVGATVELRSGFGAEGPLVGTFVESEGPAEGDFALTPIERRIPSGRYTLVHDDGATNLTAFIDLANPMLVILR